MRFRLKEAIEIQIRTDEERNEFLASITHDLKTPITSIKGYVAGIKDGVADTKEKMDKYIDTINRKADDMDKLINDLTYISNQTLNKIPYNFSKISIKVFMEDFIDEYQIEYDKNNVKFSISGDVDKEVIVKADVEKLKRVVVNIVNNSIKYMDKKDKFIDIILINKKIMF